MKETWKLLNSVMKPKKSSVKINKLIIDDNIITDHQEVCNSFNEYFASVGSGIADSLPACNDHDHVAYLPVYRCAKLVFLCTRNFSRCIINIVFNEK